LHSTTYRRILEKLTGSQLANKLSALYVTRRFIASFSSAHHLSLSYAISVQSMTPSHFLKIHFNITLPITPRSSKWFFTSASPLKPYTQLFSAPCVLHAPPISLFLGYVTDCKTYYGINSVRQYNCFYYTR